MPYDTVGMTTDQRPANDHRTIGCTVDLGRGQEVFDRAVRAIQQWEVHAPERLAAIHKATHPGATLPGRHTSP